MDENYNINNSDSQRPKRGNFWKNFILALFVAILSSALTIGILVYTGEVSMLPKASEKAKGTVLNQDVQNKIGQVLGIMEHYYYEDIDQKKLSEGLYAGLVNSLGDPYSTYFSAEQYTSYKESSTGKYCGIGAVLSQNEKTKIVSIVRAYEGSPAALAGLKAGDVILSVDGVEATSMELTEFVTHIKGDEGTSVHVVVNRQGETKKLSFDITRKQIQVPTVSSKMLENKIGYLAITEFGDKDVTAKQFSEALTSLKKEGMKKLIIDVRDNPGGMLDTVSQMLYEILPNGKVVYTQDKAGNKQVYESNDDKELKMPLAVLVNGNSASASEIFAGAVKDYKYGTLIGTKTFGKGIVQVLIPLTDGSAVKVTMAKYYTPNGNYIHKKGIEPDVTLEYNYLGDKSQPYDMMKDNQLLKAIEVLNQK